MKANIGIGPSYNIEKFDFINTNDSGGTFIDFDDEQKIRWSMNFYLNWEVNKYLNIVSDNWYHLLQKGETNSFDVYDSGPSNFNMSFIFNLTKDLALSYRSELIWNKLQKRREFELKLVSNLMQDLFFLFYIMPSSLVAI